MNSKINISLITLAILFGVQTIDAKTNFQSSAPATVNNNISTNNLQGYALFVPAGATCPVILSQALEDGRISENLEIL